MSDLFTDEDVTAVVKALGEDSWRRTGATGTAQAVLAAVAPQIAARALRHAADEWDALYADTLPSWFMRARADDIEGDDQ